MKTSKIAFLFLFIFIFMFSCNDDIGGNHSDFNNEDNDIFNIEINVLSEHEASAGPYPKIVISMNDWNIIEYASKGLDHEEIATFHFMNSKEKISMIVSGYKSTLLFFEYNPFTKEKSDTVVIAAKRNNYKSMALCIMNWSDNSYRVLSETIFDEPSILKIYGDDGFDDTREIIASTFDDLSYYISKSTALPSKFSDAVGIIAEVWNKFAIPYAKYSLYEGRPEIQEEICEEYKNDWAEEYMLKIVPRKISYIYKVSKEAYNTAKNYLGNMQFDVSDEVIDNFSYEISVMSNTTYIPQMIYEEEYAKYKVNAMVLSVDKTSAIVSANFDCMDGQPSFISEFGMDLIGMDGKKYNETFLDFEGDIKIVGLTPGTEYYVSMYIISLGRKYEKTLTFTTDFDLILYPEKLSFTSEGGTKIVSMNLPEKGYISWDIKSKPSWCKIEKGKNSFFVEVEKYNNDRSGKITVEVKLNDGHSVQKSMDISQLKNNDGWNGTKWNFAGTILTTGKWVGEPVNREDLFNFDIEIINIENNEFKLFKDMAEFQGVSKIYYNQSNHLILEYKDNFGSIYSGGKVEFTRIDTQSAKGKYTAYLNDEKEGVDLKGEGDLSGKLVN